MRNSRYKLIQNLLPGRVNPGYAFTLNRFFSKLQQTIDAAPRQVREAYRTMETPPEYELYDLKNDPFEFKNLVDDAEHAVAFAELKEQLASWRESTKDPLLDAQNLKMLQEEVAGCFKDGKPEKSRLRLNYAEYFFD